jgi:hypothetical protein
MLYVVQCVSWDTLPALPQNREMLAGCCVTPLEMAHYGDPLGTAPLLGTLEDMLRKALYTGISLHRGTFTSEGNLESGGWAHIPRTLNDE